MANQYFTCELSVWVSGTTIYARMHYYRSGTYTYQDTAFPTPTLSIDGTNFSDTDFANRVHSGISVGDVYTTTFSKTFSANGTYGVSFSAGSGLRSDFAGTWTGSATVTEAYTNPSTPSVTLKSKTYNSATFAVSIGSYGNPGSASGRYIEAAIMAQNSYGNSYRYNIASNTTSATITVNNSSRTGSTALTIQGNKKYWYGGYATNTQRSVSTITGSFYTPCPPLSALALSSQAYSSYDTVNATLSYTRQSDGGAETRTGKYRYSTDNGSTWNGWASFGTVSSTTGTFVVTLPTSSSVLLQARLDTPNGGASESKQVSITTKTTHTAPSFSDFDYEDSNSSTVAISGNNQIFIQGQSQPMVTISVENKATANDEATITGYTANLNAQSIQIAYSSTDDVSGAFNNNTPNAYGTLALSVAANDSLSLAKSVSKNVVVIPWSAPTITASATRVNNFEAQTTLAISGAYSPVVIDGVVKNTLSVSYRYKKTTDSEWGDWVSRPITITDSVFEADDLILSFDNEKQWDIEVIATDAFTTTTVSLALSVGKPIFFIDQNGKCSINRKPTNSAADLDVDGMIYAQDQPVMTSHVGMIIMSKSLTTAADVRALYGGYWTSDSSFSATGVYCWRRTS